MTCLVCGSTYPCEHSRMSAAILVDPGPMEEHEQGVSPSLPGQPADQQWRREVISRVQQHRARRRKRFDPDASLELGFPQEDPSQPHDEPAPERRYTAAALQGGFRADLDTVLDMQPVQEHEEIPHNDPPNVIHFPKAVAPPTILERPGREEMELAEPVLDTPRIFEVDEVEVEEAEVDEAEVDEARAVAAADEPQAIAAEAYAPLGDAEEIYDRNAAYPEHRPPRAQQLDLLPSFEDIRLESSLAEEADLIPRPAPLGQRMVAGIADGGIVLAAVWLFHLAFTRLAEDNPHSRVALLSSLLVGGLLWTLYQYLFLVHGHGTPGMQLARLELATFEGQPVAVKDRRWRALASALSGLSLGLGYLWALVDEDQLGWHDRMTQTLLKSSTQQGGLPPWL